MATCKQISENFLITLILALTADNLQNRSLIYDENAEVEFISKYGSYDSDTCFLNLDARIKNIIKCYDDIDNLEKDEVPYTNTLREEQI